MTDDEVDFVEASVPIITEDFRSFVDVMESRGRSPEDLFFVCMFGVAAFHGASDRYTRARIEQAVRALLIQLYSAKPHGRAEVGVPP